jgi:hypothetical protein
VAGGRIVVAVLVTAVTDAVVARAKVRSRPAIETM